MIKVSIASTNDRSEGVTRSLELIDSEINIPDRPVMVKPNFVTTSNQLAATHVDATRATGTNRRSGEYRASALEQCSPIQ